MGASGSKHAMASCLVPSGTPFHSRGGDLFSPSPVYWRGIFPCCSNALLLMLSVPSFGCDDMLTRVARRGRPYLVFGVRPGPAESPWKLASRHAGAGPGLEG